MASSARSTPRLSTSHWTYSRPRSQPAPQEGGVACALRPHIPVVVAGRTVLNPYDDYAAEIHAFHMAAICQIRQRHSEGRAYFDRRVAEGKTKKEALRVLKRHVSNAVYRRLLADAQRTRS